MIDDLSKISDVVFSEKWNISFPAIIRFRKRNGIKSFLSQHNLREHRFDGGVEKKYCPKDGGHWDDVKNFGKGNNRYDGLRGICKVHEGADRKVDYYLNNRREQAAAWRGTESGKASLRNTWRKEKARKDNAYVQWSRADEDKSYKVFGGRCAYCGNEVDFLKTEFDHVVPIAKQGKTEPKNMVPCCKNCNHGPDGKFKRDLAEWLIFRFGKDRAEWIYSDIQHKLRIIVG